MLIRISLILALLAALAVGVVNVVVVKDKINTLVTDRNTQRDGRRTAESGWSQSKKDLAKAKDDLTLSQQELAAAKTEREKAVTLAAAQSKRAEDLADKLTKSASCPVRSRT